MSHAILNFLMPLIKQIIVITPVQKLEDETYETMEYPQESVHTMEYPQYEMHINYHNVLYIGLITSAISFTIGCIFGFVYFFYKQEQKRKRLAAGEYDQMIMNQTSAT